MRDIFFKNRTSADNKRKIIASSEISDTQGVHSVIRRHFVYIVKEVKGDSQIERPQPWVHILKERNTKEHRERFVCRLKGSMYALNNKKLFLVVFMHSLSINLTAIPAQDLINH